MNLIKPRLFLSLAFFICLTLGIGISASTALAGTCGGTGASRVECQCGDVVTSNYVMDKPLGPCLWTSEPELTGLWVESNVTLDCNGHTISGPSDNQKQEFGIRVGSAPFPVNNATIKDCQVTGFWWGAYLRGDESNPTTNVVIEDSRFFENGWKHPSQNGTGYGINVTNSEQVTIQDSDIVDNGNEGIHLSGAQHVSILNNTLIENGFENLYFLRSSWNTTKGNTTQGARQGLEMRWSNNNDFEGNVWDGPKRNWLENDNNNNTFVNDVFNGPLFVSKDSTGNAFEYCHFYGPVEVISRSHGSRFETSFFEHPDKWCLQLKGAQNTYLYKAHFGDCWKHIKMNGAHDTILDRSIGAEILVPKKKFVTQIYAGCTADMDDNGEVDATDEAVIDAAFGSSVGDANWEPEADLNHDGVIDSADRDLFDIQVGSCDDAGRVNEPPRAILSVRRLTKVKGQPDRVRLSGAASRDDDGIVSYHFVVKVKQTGQTVFETTTPNDTIEETFATGSYLVYLTVKDTDDVESKTVKRGLRAN